MNDEDQIRRAQIILNLPPLALCQGRAEIIGRKMKVNRILAIYFSLCLFERSEKT